MRTTISRRLERSKSNKNLTVNKVSSPSNQDGHNGDIQVRQSSIGAKIWAKIGGKWLSNILYSPAVNISLETNRDINLSPKGDVNIPANVGLTFGDDGEKIEGDGTDLTISSGDDIILNATGKVGIGVTDPDVPLHVYEDNSNTDQVGLYIEQDGAGDVALKLGLSGSVHYILGIDNTDNFLKLGYHASSESQPVTQGTRLTIDTSGNVGVGTAAPASELHVKGTGGDILRLESTEANNAPYIAFYDSSAKKGTIGWSGYGDTDAITIANEEAAGDIRFNTGGDTFAVIIDQAQNVGIGNTSPGNLLEVSKVTGDAALELSSWSATDTHSGTLLFQKSSIATVNTFGDGAGTAASETLGRIEAWGATQDGTAADDIAKLSSYIEFANDAASREGTVPGKIAFATAPDSDDAVPAVAMSIDDGGDVLVANKLYLSDVGGEYIEGDGTHLTIAVDGTLKVNTNKILVTSTESTDTTPYPELQLYRNADVQDTGVDSTYGTIGVLYFMGLNSSGGKETYGYLRCIIEDDQIGSEDATIQIGSKNNGGVSDVVYIRDDRVGINIAPSYSLDVSAATSGYASAFRNDGNNANRKGIFIQCGVDSPSSQGDCVYIDFFDGDATAAGGIRCGSTVANPEFFNGSDIRIKENIIDTKIDALSLLNKLQFREYTYKNNGIKDEIGLIAQEVEPILPQMVSKMNANGYEEYLDGDTEMLALGRETLVYYMAKSIQELSSKIDAMQVEINNLK